MRVFDLASIALRKGGSFYGINFTPYVEYAFQYDDGEIMRRIAEMNVAYALGKADLPGGYLQKDLGPFGITLKQLIQRTDIADDDGTFIYMDAPTVEGLLEKWSMTRNVRGLETDLRLVEGFYFSPDRITAFNKFVSGEKALHNRENYLFRLQKV